MRLISQRVLTICGLAVALSLAGCGKKDKSDDEDTTDDTAGGAGGGGGGTSDSVTVAGKLSVGATLNLTAALTDLKLFCVTFEETPRSAASEFGEDGSFSVTLPKNVNFGCFVNDKTTNLSIASFVVVPDAGFGGGSTSMALSGSVDLGALVLGTDGTVSIPAAALAGNVSSSVAGIDVDQMHGHSYKMECQDNGNAEVLAKCNEQLNGDGKGMGVYFRILKGKQEDRDILGLGVWASADGFAACGSKDMEQTMLDKLATDNIVLSQVTVGSFTVGAGCELRDDGSNQDESEMSRKLQNLYALSELVKNGPGYSFRDHNGGGDEHCNREHSTAIEFTGTADVMFGAFTTSEHVNGDCGSEEKKDDFAAFAVKFTKVD